MSQLPKEFENPIDYYLGKICQFVAPAFAWTNHTANEITLEGLVLSLWGLWNLCQGNLMKFTIGYGLGYFFDCLDGFFARKYNDTSKFGEYFEHSKDIGCGILYFIILYNSYSVPSWMVCTSIFLLGGLTLQLAHQQRLLRSSGGVLDILQPLVKNVKNIQYTRYIGCGTFMLWSLLMPWLLNRN